VHLEHGPAADAVLAALHVLGTTLRGLRDAPAAPGLARATGMALDPVRGARRGGRRGPVAGTAGVDRRRQRRARNSRRPTGGWPVTCATVSATTSSSPAAIAV
jgi:hypothetical protein